MQDVAGEFTSIYQNNVLPFEQERVGPGILGKAEQGYQQLDVNEVVRPKTIDELRIEPKESFAGRTVDGQKGSVRGELGDVRPNRFVRFVSQTVDNLFRTLGATTKPTATMKFAPRTDRRLDDVELSEKGQFVGAASAAADRRKFQANFYEDKVKDFKDGRELADGARRPNPGDRTRRGRGAADDHGRDTILVYENTKKDAAVKAVYDGGLTTLIKAMVAPLQDVVRPTDARRQKAHYRERGNVSQPAGLRKGVAKDPDDVARRTIRESTSESFDTAGSIGAPVYKLTVYDPDDVTRATVKQATLEETARLNLRGPYKLTIYDPAEIARTTLKQQLSDDAAPQANLSGARRATTARDPDDGRARTTLKEQLSQRDADAINVSTGHARATARDPDARFRTTLKEQLCQRDAEAINVSTGHARATARDPDARFRTTLKEQLSQQEAEAINVATGHARATARDPDARFRTTLKEQLSQQEAEAINVATGHARATARDPDARFRTTLKEQLSQQEAEAINLAGPRRATSVDPAAARFRTTLKEQLSQHDADAANVAGPRRATARDPDGRARTTAKELLDGQEAETLNFFGPTRSTARDPDDRTKTTLRELLDEQEREAANLAGPKRASARDPDSLAARGTLKEPFAQDADLTNLSGPSRTPVFDPDNLLKRTIRETTGADGGGAGQVLQLPLGQTAGAARSADDVARTTLKQDVVRDGTFDGHVYVPTRAEVVVDEDSTVGPTLKDAAASSGRGHVQGAARSGVNSGYVVSEYDAPGTYREMTTVNRRKTVSAKAGAADAYRVVDADAKPTQKQSTNPERTGQVRGGAPRSASYESMYNATIDSLKEELLEGREFTGSSAKSTAGAAELGEGTRGFLERREISLAPTNSSFAGGGRGAPLYHADATAAAVASRSVVNRSTRDVEFDFGPKSRLPDFDADPSRGGGGGGGGGRSTG
jgi:ribosomal protein L7/L12